MTDTSPGPNSEKLMQVSSVKMDIGYKGQNFLVLITYLSDYSATPKVQWRLQFSTHILMIRTGDHAFDTRNDYDLL